MSSKKIISIINSIPEDQHDDFLVAVGDLHTRLRSGAELILMSATATEDDDDSAGDDDDNGDFSGELSWGDSDVYGDDEDLSDLEEEEEEEEEEEGETLEDIVEKMIVSFRMRGLQAVKDYLDHSIGAPYLDLNKLGSFMPLVEGAIKAYGVKEFISKDGFEGFKALFRDTKEMLLTYIESPGGSDEDVIQSPEDEASNKIGLKMVRPSIVEKLPPRKHYPIKDRSKAPYSEPISLTQNIFLGMDDSEGFFKNDSETYFELLSSKKASEESVSALNFHPMFSRLGLDVTPISLSEDGSSVVFDESVMREVVTSVTAYLSGLVTMVDADIYRRASKAEVKGRFYDVLKELELSRKLYCTALDDAVDAIMMWDDHVNKAVYEYDAEMPKALVAKRPYQIRGIINDKSSDLFKAILVLAHRLVFMKQTAPGSGVYKFNLSSAHKETHSQWVAAYERSFSPLVARKILEYFNNPSKNNPSEAPDGQSARRSFTSSLRRAVKPDILWKEGHNKARNLVTKRQEVSKCSTCGVMIRTRMSTRSAPGIRGNRINKSSYSEYAGVQYGLVREGSDPESISVITRGELLEHGPFLPPPDVDGAEPMTWETIEGLVSSGARSKHIEGVKRRSWALKEMGGLPISGKTKEVSDHKYKCPYTNSLEVQSPKCGLTISFDSIFSADGTPVSPEFLQSASHTDTSGASEADFASALSEAVSAGSITEGQMDSYLKELAKRQGGGWKFSNTYFRCPSRILVPKESQSYKSFMAEGYGGRFSYVAIPLSGPITKAKVESGSVRLPSNPDGTPSNIEDGTLSYYVCGEKTSLSSFLRDENAEGSLPSILKSRMQQGGEGPSKMFVTNLINTLIMFGVDIADILPFVSNVDRPQDAIDELEKSGRLERISGILAKAMAEPKDLELELGEYRDSAGLKLSLTREGVIKDIKLVCSHGHVFSIDDSVQFGLTHTGINMGARHGRQFTWEEIVESGMLFTEGEDNFEATANLRSSHGNKTLIKRVNERDIDMSEAATYEDWKRRGRNLAGNSAVPGMFGGLLFDGYGGSYKFGDVSRTRIWGSEIGKERTSAREGLSEGEAGSTMLVSGGLGESTDASAASAADRGGIDSSQRAAMEAHAESERAPSNLLDGQRDNLLDMGIPGAVKMARPLGGLIRSLVVNVQDWLAMASSLEVRGALTGSPVLLSPGAEHKMFDAAGMVTRLLIEHVLDYSDNHDESEAEAVGSGALNLFKSSYVDKLRGLDLRFLGTWGRAIDVVGNTKVLGSIVESIVSSAETWGGPEVSSKYIDTLMSNGKPTVRYILNTESLGGVSAFMDDFRRSLIPDLTSKERERILGGHTEGLLATVSQMKGREYMGRVLQASSALYLADALSRVYNVYMRSENSSEYIGYDIGADLSSVENVLALSDVDLDALEKGLSDNFIKALSHRDTATLFVNVYFEKIISCIKALEVEMFRLRTACTSEVYMSRAVDYIRNELTEVVSMEDRGEDATRAQAIIDNVMTNSPITTMSLNAGGKYATYFGSSTAPPKDPVSLIPLFSAYTAEYRGSNSLEYYPIFVLAYGDVVYSGFNFDEDLIRNLRPPTGRVAYVLSKYDLPDAIELEDLYESLPEPYRSNGWRIYSVSDEHYVVPKKGSADSENGFRAGISMIYHPGTVESTDGESVMGYHNSELNYDSQSSLQIGPQRSQRGRDSAFPPHPFLSTSNVGLPIPIDSRHIYDPKQKGVSPELKYPGDKSKRLPTKWSRAVIPITDVKIPVSLKTSDASKFLSLDLSDFLQRDPPDVAFGILAEIDRLYDSMKASLNVASSETKSEVESRYKRAISKLHDTYRGLPYYVESGVSATGKYRVGSKNQFSTNERSEAGAGSVYMPRPSEYLPLVDWPTMQRMTSPNNPQFGPEFGGHTLWSKASDIQEISETVGAIEQFLVDSHNLESLAEHIGVSLGRDIDPSDLLDPVGKLFGERVVTREEAIRLFGYDPGSSLDDEEGHIGYDDGRFPWSNDVGEKAFSKASTSVWKKFEDWKAEPGSYYKVGLGSGSNDVTGDPDAYIKVMNTVFVPSKKRDLMDRVRDANSEDIMSADLFYLHKIVSGVKGQEYYPVPADDDDFAKFKTKLGKVKNISVKKYAEALSEYLAEYVKMQHLEGFSKESRFRRVGLVKYSKSLERDIYCGGIIESERLMALWKKLTN